MELSLRERDRLSVLRQVSEGVLARSAGAARLGVTTRHLRRLLRRFEAEGDAAAVHGLRGRRSNRALPAGVRERVLEVARDPLYADFGPTLLAEHVGRRFGIVASPDTLRRWMLAAGLWERGGRRAKHCSRRPGRAALGELGVEVILAGSPQAKGRVERSFGTAQDRLVREMRVEGIATLEAANRFLEDWWVPFWNDRFTVEPADPRDAHRPLPEGADLEALFAETETRVVARDFTIRFRNRRWQIPETEAAGIAPGDEIVVERRLDGGTRFRFGGRHLNVEPAPRSTAAPAPAKPAKPRPAPPKPGPDHPWRKHFEASVRRAVARRDLRRERDAISNGKEPPSAPEPDRARGKTEPAGEDISTLG